MFQQVKPLGSPKTLTDSVIVENRQIVNLAFDIMQVLAFPVVIHGESFGFQFRYQERNLIVDYDDAARLYQPLSRHILVKRMQCREFFEP